MLRTDAGIFAADELAELVSFTGGLIGGGLVAALSNVVMDTGGLASPGPAGGLAGPGPAGGLAGPEPAIVSLCFRRIGVIATVGLADLTSDASHE